MNLQPVYLDAQFDPLDDQKEINLPPGVAPAAVRAQILHVCGKTLLMEALKAARERDSKYGVGVATPMQQTPPGGAQA